ncbi:MAG: DUF3341 domain-containing protein [Bacteroidia bacterium]|nr:DUF3341 domain-containing protein [Bacteroidia bacterium]
MLKKNKIHILFGDEEPLLKTVIELRKAGIRIKDAFTPFPVHGLDAAMGLPRTRIAIASFIYGITGTSLATLMMWYMMIHDWPNDIGGKPNWAYYYNMPSFIPITFESTVFCAAHLMVFTYLMASWLLPGVRPKNPDPRTTDDKFMLYLELTEEQTKLAESIAKKIGAEEFEIKGEFYLEPKY